MSITEKPKAGLSWALTFVSIPLAVLTLSTNLAVGQEKFVAFDPYPLRPADTSSPRDTLQSFFTNINQAVHAWQTGADRDVVAKPRDRARETLDSSALPVRGRLVRELESVLLLVEILGRIELPPDEEIPGDAKVEDQALTRWTIPNTQITIAKIEEGPRAGEFLFSAETVRRLGEFYRRVKDLPYKPGAMVGIYDEVAYSPGPIVPLSWGNVLPHWSKTAILGVALWQWLVLATLATLAFFVVIGLLRWGQRWDDRHRSAGVLKRFGTALAVVGGIFIIYLCRFVAVVVVQVSSEWWTAASVVLWGLIFAGIGWLIVLATARMAEAVNEARQTEEGSIDTQLVRTLFRLLSLVLLVLLVLYAASFLGIPLTPVAASLGIGGLAIALAVRPTLENIIGGLTLFADKPVRIGNFCRFGDDYGTVEEIGLRSTRLRKLDDTLVSVPNADFSQRELTNYARRRCRLYQTILGLRYETTPEQLRYVITKLREMLIGHPKVSPESLHVRFHSFGAYSLDLKLFAYIRTRDWLDYLAIREDINLRVMAIVTEAGTGFAFPSQTAYLSRDSGLDVERGQQAEEAVQDWRSKGELPFPAFDEKLLVEKRDALDYPPPGSPDYKPRTGVSAPPT